MTKTYSIRVPTHITMGQDKKTYKDITVALNMNGYRNMHYQPLNNLKKMFKSLVEGRLKRDCPIYTSPVAIRYVVHWGTNHRADLGNICSVADKFFSDALTETGRIPDDDMKFVQRILFEVGSIGVVQHSHIIISVKPLNRKYHAQV